jgi:hypothetical protein
MVPCEGEVKGRVERWRGGVGFDIFCFGVSPAKEVKEEVKEVKKGRSKGVGEEVKGSPITARVKRPLAGGLGLCC